METTFKKGDLIGHHTMKGTSLCRIIRIYEMFYGDTCIDAEVLYDENLVKPYSRCVKNIFLPEQRYEVLTFEEYTESIQNEINRKQNILNKIKDMKNVRK